MCSSPDDVNFLQLVCSDRLQPLVQLSRRKKNIHIFVSDLERSGG